MSGAVELATRFSQPVTQDIDGFFTCDLSRRFLAICQPFRRQTGVDCVWNVMAHTQKPDFVFRRNGRVHLNRQGSHFSRLLAAEVCASAVVMLAGYTKFRGSVKGIGYPLHSPVSPSLPLTCFIVCHHILAVIYLI